MEQPIVVSVENLQALRRVRWTLPYSGSVSLLIGPNGSGKSTLLSVLRFFTDVLSSGPDVAAGRLGASRSWGVGADEPIRVILEKGDLRWVLELVNGRVDEHLSQGGEEIFVVRERRIAHRGTILGSMGLNCGLSFLIWKEEKAVRAMREVVEHLHSYREPALHLVKEGHTIAGPLGPAMENTFRILHRLEPRGYTFVLDGLRLAFPQLVEDIQLDVQGQAFSQLAKAIQCDVRVVPPGGHASVGLDPVMVQLLAVLVALASAERGDVVALDNPDLRLHPDAVCAFFRMASSWARLRDLTVILATHSGVLLDQMRGSLDGIYVVGKGGDPRPLTDLYNREYLEAFMPSEMYANGVFGSSFQDE